MGKDLKGKELGKGITQRKDGRYYARFVDRFGNRKSLYATSVVEIRRLLKEAEKENAEKTSVKNAIWCTTGTKSGCGSINHQTSG